jgi:hypothetical protein
VNGFEFALALVPVSAALAGLLLWSTNRDQTLGDAALVVRFTLWLATITAVAAAIGRTEAVQLRINPAVRAQRQVDSHPVFAAFRQHLPGELPQLQQVLLEQISAGATLDGAFHRIRPWLSRVAVDRLGFADVDARVDWGRETVAMLHDLQRVDPQDCYRAIAAQPLSAATLDSAFGTAEDARFQQAVVAVLASGDHAQARELAADQRVDLSAAQAEYRVLRETLASQVGPEAAQAVATKQFAATPTLPADQICTARIAELEAILERPRPMAAFLLDAVLR